MPVKKNELSKYLQKLGRIQSKNLNPALVVYVRDSGVTAADLQKARADAATSRRWPS